jgi:hypothetical protein
MSTSNGAQVFTAPVTKCVLLWADRPSDRSHSKTLSPVGARYDRAIPERNFPPPWSVEELDSCFVVKDANGQALAYVCLCGDLKRQRFLIWGFDGRKSGLTPLVRL